MANGLNDIFPNFCIILHHPLPRPLHTVWEAAWLPPNSGDSDTASTDAETVMGLYPTPPQLAPSTQ